MTRKEWKNQVKELKNKLGANPLVHQNASEKEYEILMGLNGRGPLASHPEIVALRESEPQESYITDYTADLPDFDRDTSRNGVE